MTNKTEMTQLISAINELNKNVKFLTQFIQELTIGVDSPDSEDVHANINPNYGVDGKKDKFVQYVRRSNR